MTEQEEKAIADLDETYRRSRLKSAKRFPEVLYHYTTSDGLLGILSSGVLRGGHFAYFNDRSEITYGLGVVQEALASMRVRPGTSLCSA